MKRILQKVCMLFVTFSVVLYANVASASPWISSPSVVNAGDDIDVQGGGAPGSTEMVIELFDAGSGQKLGETSVFTNSSGDFSTAFSNVSGTVEVRINIDGETYFSLSDVGSE